MNNSQNQSAATPLSQTPHRPLGNQSGASILEMLIAVLIGSFVVYAAMEVFVTMNDQVIWQDEVTEVQQSGRAVQRVISEHLRMAGFGLPGTLDPVSGADTNPDTITITHQAPSGCESFLAVAMANAADLVTCDSGTASCFEVGEWAYIYDAAIDSGEFFEVAAVYSGPDALLPASPLERAYPSGAGVYDIDELVYYIDQSDPEHPMLMQQRNGAQPEVYAADIEDLDIQYVMSNGDTVLVPLQPRQVRNVLVTLVARSSRVDKGISEDYRRREIAFNVSIRNQEW